MPFTSYATDYQLNQWAASKGLYMSLHSAYSLTGGNELAGGSYARVAPTWASAAGGVLSLSGTPYAMNAPASSTVGWIGFWDAATSGNFSGMWPNAATASAYAFSVPSSTGTFLAPGSAYAATQTVVAFPTGGSALPSGLVAGTTYFVLTPSSDSFGLSTTSGGSPVTLTSDGSGYLQAVTFETFGSAGVFDVSAFSITQV
jgi:hypothetical protein